MIPIKLSMRNFMCYREGVPPLSFTGIHTACISGANGNGKSALIDAMTWALWGKARAKSDDDLIALGESDMEVEFDFAVGEELYRIIRKRSRPKKAGGQGKSILELQIATEGGFKTITGDSMAQTQNKIAADILHMDYDTFINSAFLRQGHADEFTTKRPVERKQVLADILGLSCYDDLEESAKQMAGEQETEKARLETTIAEIDGELAYQPAYEDELKQAQERLAGIDETAKGQQSRVDKLRTERDALQNKKTQLAQLEKHITEMTNGLERWREQGEQHRSRAKEYQGLIARRGEIEKGYTRFAAAYQESEELNRKLGTLLKLQEGKSRLEKEVQRAQAELLTEHTVTQSRIKELQNASAGLPTLKENRQQAGAMLKRLARDEESLRGKRQQSQELQAEVNRLESSIAQLEQRIKEAEEKLGLLATKSGDKCPLCQSKLEAEGRERIKAKYNDDKQTDTAGLKASRAELAEKKRRLQGLGGEIAALESKLSRDKASAQQNVSLLDKEIADAEQSGKKLAEEEEELGGIEERLARKDFAPNEQEALTKLEKQLTELGYDSGRHEQARSRLAEAEPYQKQKQQLDEADRLISQEQDDTAKADKAAAELEQSLASDKQTRQGLAEELAALPEVVERLSQAETEHRVTAAQQQEAQETIGRVKGKLGHLAELETKRKEKKQLLEDATKEEAIYRELAQAFGKKGIQALLIERALPEIEVEANHLLGRMTDNRMHVEMETQRQTKKGDTVETLDINISDELGTRNYEMFSGGESFRINFAIRIALSKLLARRAGAPLPTLIIDEGFGTQDTVGIEKLKEAINSIQDDFDKILVITHIEELRDAFPTRINVVKTAQGSTLEVT